MNLGNVVIKEAVGLSPLQLLEKFLGKSFSAVMTKLTGSEAEQFALKFISEVEEVIEKKAGGKTIEQLAEDAGSRLSRKVLREVLERAEYTAFRETIAEAIVSTNYSIIKQILKKYPRVNEDGIVKGQAVSEIGRILGVPPGISKEFFGEWNKMVAAEEAAMGKFGTKAGEQGAEQGVVKAGEQGVAKIGDDVGIITNDIVRNSTGEGTDEFFRILESGTANPVDEMLEMLRAQIRKLGLKGIPKGWENEFIQELKAIINQILESKGSQKLIKDSEELERIWPTLSPTKQSELLENAIEGTRKLANKNGYWGRYSRFLGGQLGKKAAGEAPRFSGWVKKSIWFATISAALDILRYYEDRKLGIPFKGHFGLSTPGTILLKLGNSCLGPFSIFLNGFFLGDSVVRTTIETAKYGATSSDVDKREADAKAAEEKKKKEETDKMANPDITEAEAREYVESNSNPLQLNPKIDFPIRYKVAPDKKSVDVFVNGVDEKVSTVKKKFEIPTAGGNAISKIIEVK
jgi:hypothetical protein